MPEPDSLHWRCYVCKQSPLTIEPSTVQCPRCERQYRLSNSVWECEENFSPSGFPASSSTHLLDIEQDHFWFAARDRLLKTKLLNLKRPQDKSILELGCGSGRVLSTLTEYFPQTVGIEGHLSAVKLATETCPDSRLLHADVLNTPLADEQFDWVVAFDVLEHVDPARFLEEAFRLTRPGGRLLVSVPAFPLLWSYVDQAAGHRCRYRLKQLSTELEATGWCIQGYTYFQFLLFPLLAVNRLLNRDKQSKLERKPPNTINKILGKINHLEINLFHKLSLPFGSSLVAWAEKPNTKKEDHD